MVCHQYKKLIIKGSLVFRNDISLFVCKQNIKWPFILLQKGGIQCIIAVVEHWVWKITDQNESIFEIPWYQDSSYFDFTNIIIFWI